MYTLYTFAGVTCNSDCVHTHCAIAYSLIVHVEDYHWQLRLTLSAATCILKDAVHQIVSMLTPLSVLVRVQTTATTTTIQVFTALALFNQLRFPLYFFPVTLSALADGRVSVDRLSSFLSEAEVVPYVQR
jgi:hypothetical protein